MNVPLVKSQHIKVQKELRTYQILVVDLWWSSILFISAILTFLIFYNNFSYLLIVFSMDYFI
jgi:hypothetical protein